jgi:hypothetical protein
MVTRVRGERLGIAQLSCTFRSWSGYYTVSMTIEYALTRVEILRGFFGSLRASRKYLITILTYSLVVGSMVPLGRGALSRPLRPNDIVSFLGGVVGFMLFLPLMLFIRAKTSSRSLTISAVGISTTIGSLVGDIFWRQIGAVEEGDAFVLIARTNGNAFFIPDRAFSSPEERVKFVDQARSWAQSAE